MTKINKKNFIYVVLLFVIIFATFLLGGCAGFYSIYVIDSEYLINRVIYTATPDKYLNGATIVKLQSDTIKDLAEGIKGLTIIESQLDGYVDVVFDIRDDEGNIASTFYNGETTVAGMIKGYEPSQVAFDCSHLFSGIVQYFTAGGEKRCNEDENCECRFDWDFVTDFICHTRSGSTYYDGDVITTSNTQMTEAEIRTNFNLECPTCDTYIEEYDEASGQYVYTYYSFHSSDGYFEHDGTFEEVNESYYTMGEKENELILTTYKELIVEDFDFSIVQDKLKSFNYDNCYTNWEDYYNPTDFSNMFSDLPVEKITIANVSGFGEDVTDVSGMFANCPNLTTINFGNLLDYVKPTNISRMFYNCPKLVNIDISNLDTSRVTDMSEIFAISTNVMTSEYREILINQFINTEIRKIFDEEALGVMDPDTNYTLDSFVELMQQTFPDDELKKEEILLLMCVDYGLEVPITFNELCMSTWNMSWMEAYEYFTTHPEELHWDPAGQYYPTDVIEWLEGWIYRNKLNISLVYDANLIANSRDEYIEYFLNNEWIELYPANDNGTWHTIHNIELVGTTVEEFLLLINQRFGIQIPMTYDEAIKATGLFASFDQFYEYFKQNPAEFSANEIVREYTVDEAKYLIQILANSDAYNHIPVTSLEEIDKHYAGREPSVVPSGTLVLGGNNSKFVINAGVNTYGMFSGNQNFGAIVTPSAMGEQVNLQLSAPYLDKNNKTTCYVKSSSNNQRLLYNVSESKYEDLIQGATTPTIITPSDSGGFKVNMTIIYIIIGSSVAIASIVVVVALMPKRKKW